MKHSKLLSLLSAALLGLSAAAFPPALPDESAGIVAEAATTQTFTYGDFEYSYVSGSNEATLKRYLGSSTTVGIPAQVPAPDGSQKTVTTIGTRAFLMSVNGSAIPKIPKNITAVTIPTTVTKIGISAFSGTPLKELVIPSSVQKIDTSAFEGCTELKKIDIQGETLIGMRAFAGCAALKTAKINENCTAVNAAFTDCTALEKVRNNFPWYHSYSSNGMPVFNSNSAIRKVVENVFYKSGSKNVKFMTDYSNALCEYIVKTETTTGRTNPDGSSNDWMGEAVKARQLHDWLIRHVDYEDQLNGESLRDENNHTVEGLCLSFGLNIRGQGVGETVCEGYARTYKKLLDLAGVEAYVLHGDTVELSTGDTDGHAWNLVKNGNKFYQVDVTADEGLSHGVAENDPLGTRYSLFMVSDDDRYMRHMAYSGFIITGTRLHGDNETPQAEAALANSADSSMTDTNGDGILDWNWNYDNTLDYTDYVTYQTLAAALNIPEVPLGSMSTFLYNLHYSFNMSPAQWCAYGY